MIAKNQVFELEITGQTHDGLGVGRKDSMAVFVQGAIAGERVMAKVIKVLKNYAVARIEAFIEMSRIVLSPSVLSTNAAEAAAFST